MSEKLVVMTMGDKALIFTFIDFLDRIAIFFEVLFKKSLPLAAGWGA